MEITFWIAKANQWDGSVHPDEPERDGKANRAMNKAVAKQAISKAEIAWNGQNANAGVVEKFVSGSDLTGALGGEVVESFVAWALA